MPVDASHHAPAELIVSGNVTLRGGDVVADTDNTYAVPRQDQTVTGGSAALSAAQNMSVAGSMVLSGGQATAISDYQDYEVPERGAAGRGWRDDRANRRQSRGGRGPGRADGSRHGILRRGALRIGAGRRGEPGSGPQPERGRGFRDRRRSGGRDAGVVGSGAAQELREAIQVTVGGDASVAGRLELFGGQALAENQSSEDVLASARWRPVMLDVGGKLAVTGDTTLHGTDANVIRVGEARAVGDGRASDAGVMRIRVTGDSVIGGGLALQAGSADIMSTRSASDTAQATGQSVQYGARRPARRPGHHAASGIGQGGTSGRDLRFNGVAKGATAAFRRAPT